MATLIITVLLGLLFAWFAVVNTQNVSVNIANTLLTVPLFMLVIGSVLIGLLIAAVISSIDWISSSFALRNRESQIKEKEQTVEQLSTKVHDLEVENARLKGVDKDPVIIEKSRTEEKPRSFFNKFRYHPTV
jgi:lipopolysaccharide assembly protein A